MVATGVEGAYSPAVRGGAVAQQPLWTISYSRRQKMWQVAEKVYVARQYCRVDWHAWEKIIWFIKVDSTALPVTWTSIHEADKTNKQTNKQKRVRYLLQEASPLDYALFVGHLAVGFQEMHIIIILTIKIIINE